MGNDLLTGHMGKRISLPGHFDVPVVLEDVRPLGANASAGYECRVRLPDGSLEEAVISAAEAAACQRVSTHPRLRFIENQVFISGANQTKESLNHLRASSKLLLNVCFTG
jgi:hypothetical protein